MFSVRYEVNFLILFRINSIFRGFQTNLCLTQTVSPPFSFRTLSVLALELITQTERVLKELFGFAQYHHTKFSTGFCSSSAMCLKKGDTRFEFCLLHQLSRIESLVIGLIQPTWMPRYFLQIGHDNQFPSPYLLIIFQFDFGPHKIKSNSNIRINQFR